jgi:outer membrane protein OmpA-like peptidoglycan-associated protein
MLAPAGFAQQQNDTTADNSSGAPAKPAKPAAGSPKPAASTGASNADAHIKPGTDYSHWEAAVGYSFLDFRPGAAVTGTEKMNGGNGSIAYYVNHWFGLTFDFGGYHTGSLNYGSGNVNVDATGYTYMGGPRFAFRNASRWTPFAEVLFGGVRGSENMLHLSTTASENAFGFMGGGGLDLKLTKHVSWRVVETDYLFSHFDVPSSSTHQSNIRISSGLLFNWGAHPEMVNRPPTASLTADKNSIVQGSTESVGLHCAANDPDGDSLTYTYTSTGGRVDGSGPEARWAANGAGPGNNTITCHVDDGHGGTAAASVDIGVTAPPPPPPAPKPPTMSCSVDRSTVMAGERVGVSAAASSPQNFTLSYTWRANAGQVVGTGSSVQFDTSGLGPGSYTITGRADDGHGQAADCTVNVTVQQPPPPPQASKINECAFKPALSARVDNVCKRVLDDVALRLQNEPKGTVVIVGFADPKSKTAAKLGTSRAQNAATYLTGKGIDKSRITVRSGSGQEGAGAANHRIDIVWVPDGATY